MDATSDPRPPLDADRLPAGVEILAEASSTNAVLADRARSGALEGTVVVAEHQTAGRGRLDRTWETPPRAALTFSVLLRPNLPASAWPWIPLLTGYAVQAALADRLPAIALKWPNDVLVEERKLGGILVERIETPTGPAAVVGIGINVSQSLDELPVALATSLALELPQAPDRTEVLAQLLGSIDGLLPLLEDTIALRAAYADACSTLGREVEVELPGGVQVRGTAMDVDGEGRLVVAGPAGETVVGAGDVVHVRPDSLT
ncbi:biotin--[acetyl-CoA-carboxylase] ligase [Nocardioides guangzhouensis]|uniref:biotin--[biotin carboxyl-carrier protein] ligase n=1 Tax=Nocardioides guangzhouensis TaxID=2497878 RepID=A0A4Q4Z8F9_9ACTN|nr:biotin--[acetyl-CoA-carboxylase] ligase [Nocardioides guangzhouensis]RYP83396.1 biotin--[acetyl-CoA-carboxylase] ligase [Nocardioides guangzhouensis]